MNHVYASGVAVEVPRDLRQAERLLSRDPREVVMDPTRSRSIAMTIPERESIVSMKSKREKQILRTAAAWIPLAHCGDLPCLNETIDRLKKNVQIIFLNGCRGSLRLPIAFACRIKNIPLKNCRTRH